MNETERPYNPEDPREQYQIGNDGVSQDYFNYPYGPLLAMETDLEESRMRELITEAIRGYISYSEYTDKVNRGVLTQYLTEKGREKIARIDEVALEIQGMRNLKPEELDLGRIKDLLMEVKGLIYG